MKNTLLSLCLCLTTGLAVGGIQANDAVVNWTAPNQFEYLVLQEKQAVLIKFDAEAGQIAYQLADQPTQHHQFKPNSKLLPSRLQETLKYPYHNISESGIMLKNACGGRRAIFDRTMATYVNALRNGASQDTLNALASAVWDAFSEWMFCMIR